MVDIPTVSAIVVAGSVVIGLVFTLMELRHMARTRRTEIILRIYERFSTREMVDAINKVGRLRFEKAGNPPEDVLTGVMEVATVLEGLGVLLDEKLVDIRLLNSLFGPTLDTLWEPMWPIIGRMREGLKEPFFFSHF